MSSKARVLRQLFLSKDIIRIVGAHDGLGAKLIEKNGFDGVWASGLEISTSHAVPDANILTMAEFLAAASVMNSATFLPVICDCDTGFGNASNVKHLVKKYEAAGLAAVVIEDKLFPKVNSFVPGRQELAPVEEFMGKIEAGKNAQKDPDFMLLARIEALIAGWGLEEALKRAYAYEEAGADALVIHSKAPSPEEIFLFARKWEGAIPLVVIPTTYFNVKAVELAQKGFKMAIYANHGLRSAMRAMDETFRAIRRTDSTAAVEDKIASMKEVFEIQGMMDLKNDEKRFSKRKTLQAVIPAAGGHHRQSGFGDLLKDKPLCMIELGGQTLIDRQMDSLRSCGVTDIVVVGGYLHDRIKADSATTVFNAQHARRGNAHSVMCAKDLMTSKCVVVYSDIIFDRFILEELLESPHAITLVIDRAYQTLPPRDKKIDLVAAQDSSKNDVSRRLGVNFFKPIQQIGQHIDKKNANYEFIGMAFFREEGLREIKLAWEEALVKFKSRAFYEAPSPEEADFNDLIQYVIDRGNVVYGLEIEHGWSEIHSIEDVKRVETYLNAHSARVHQTP